MRGFLAYLIAFIGYIGVYIYFLPGFYWYTIIGGLLQFIVIIPAFLFWYNVFKLKPKRK